MLLRVTLEEGVLEELVGKPAVLAEARHGDQATRFNAAHVERITPRGMKRRDHRDARETAPLEMQIDFLQSRAALVKLREVHLRVDGLDVAQGLLRAAQRQQLSALDVDVEKIEVSRIEPQFHQQCIQRDRAHLDLLRLDDVRINLAVEFKRQ